MANWITNTLEIEGENADKVMQELATDGELDFNTVVPMPKELEGVASPARIVSEKEYEKALKEKETTEDSFFYMPITQKMANRFQKEFGATDWYEWRLANWGTKWEASESSIEENDNFVYFNTAWSMPEAFYVALSKKYPNHKFHTTWYDEDFGYNLGKATFQNGNIIEEYLPEGGSNEAYELLFELNDGIEDEFVFKDGEYKWREGEDDEEE